MSDKIKIEVEAKDTTPEDMKIAFSGSAVLSNKFYITIGNYGVRIAFTELYSLEEPPIFRTAIVMPMQDGIALYKALGQLLKGPEEALAKMNVEIQKEKENG